ARFDAFIARYNQERPHQALGMKVPADIYVRSPRIYRGLDDLTYPFHDATFTVTHCGRLCFKGRKVNLSHALAGQNIGVTQVGESSSGTARTCRPSCANCPQGAIRSSPSTAKLLICRPMKRPASKRPWSHLVRDAWSMRSAPAKSRNHRRGTRALTISRMTHS